MKLSPSAFCLLAPPIVADVPGVSARSLAIAALAGAALLLCGCIASGEGRAIDSESGQPIAGVRVLFKCEVATNIESSRTLDEFVSITDERGVYRFSLSQTRRCDHGVLRASKPGYVVMSFPFELVWNSVGGYTFQLAPEAEATMRRLRILHGATVKTAANARTAPFESPKAEYEWTYLRFMQSKTIASTPGEKAFVVENYCARLAALDGHLSPQERAAFLGRKEWVSVGSQTFQVTFDYAEQVAAWCKASV
jgi:hypothetical protein